MPLKSTEALHDLAVRVLKAAGAAGETAEAVAAEVLAAERLGLPAHGLARLPNLAQALRSGDVDGWAQPEVGLPATAVVRVDAKGGFAALALDYAVAAMQEVTDQHGAVAATVVGHRHPGPPAVYAAKLEARGLVVLSVSDTAGAVTLAAADPAALGQVGGQAGGQAAPQRPSDVDMLDVASELYDRLVLLTRRS